MSGRWETLAEQENEPWLGALLRWLGGSARPVLGWWVLLTLAALTTLPAVVVFASRWLPAGRFAPSLGLLGPLAVLLLWFLMGWRGGVNSLNPIIRIAIISAIFVTVGIFAITITLQPWLPSWATLQNAWQARDVSLVGAEIAATWGQLLGRFALWGEGVANAAAPRDSLVLATIVGAVVWLLAGITAALARTTRRGLETALPILWLSGLLLLYSPAERWVFVLALGLALLLHLLLSQQQLVASWQRRRLDYNPSLFVEQSGLAFASIALLLALAWVMPNLYIYELTARYYTLIAPMNDQVEAGVERLFPGLTGARLPWAGQGRAGGLPNQFLLGAGPDANDRIVMHVRTNEPAPGFDAPPRRHNLRGATYADYDGRGWDNPAVLTRTEHDPEVAWTALLPGPARRILLQSVNLESASAILFGAGEPLAPSVGYAATLRTDGDLVALSSAARSYTIQSAVPALDEAALAALPWWDAANPLPADLAPHLALPSSTPSRTLDLAAELVAAAPSPYAAATAIEAYLRTFPYDLAVSAPPPEVVDVADYFLFDLQRGYCDYYATAFVVLARAAGLPARFATGFAGGDWSPSEHQWVIAEADAHSWPEVYFPTVGWVAFEPTAAQPLPLRVGQISSTAGVGSPTPVFEPLSPPAPDVGYGWLGLFAALAGVAVVALVVRRLRHRPDPWLGVLAWGQAAGAPLAQGETPLEYGARLATVVQTAEGERNPELARIVGRELRALGDAVSIARYAPVAARSGSTQQVVVQWNRLRGYLRQVKVRQ
jgi:transglutaminase-like putative cysteine protease